MGVAITQIPASATDLKPVIQELADLLVQYPRASTQDREHPQLLSRRLRGPDGE